MTDFTIPESDWQPIGSAPEGIEVMTKIHDEHGARNEGPLIRKNRLWWFPDMSMYVYYTPTHWAPIKEQR